MNPNAERHSNKANLGKGEETMFNRQEYIDSILEAATTYPDDGSARIHCKNCGEDKPDWKLCTGYRQPRSMPDRLCIACWASEFADDWEEAEADMRAEV